MRAEERQMCHEVPEIDRMPDEAVHAGHDDATVCGQQAEAPTEGELASHDDRQSDS